MTTTPRSRVYNIPINVEGRGTAATTTENSHWYDNLFGKAADADDSPWGRRRRGAPPGEVPQAQPGAERSEVVIGSNPIRVAATSPSTRPRPLTWPKEPGH